MDGINGRSNQSFLRGKNDLKYKSDQILRVTVSNVKQLRPTSQPKSKETKKCNNDSNSHEMQLLKANK